MGKKLTFGNRSFNVTTHSVPVNKLSHNTQYQLRQSDSPWIRGADISKSIRDTGAESFRDNIVAVKRKGNPDFIVVDGFGRTAAARNLNWTHVNVDILSSRISEKNLQIISCTANNGQVSQKPYTRKELQEAAYRLNKESDLPYAEIAEIQNTSLETVKQRVIRGGQIAAYRDKRKEDTVGDIKPFTGNNESKGAALKLLREVFNLRSDTFDELRDVIRTKYDIEVGIHVGNNSSARMLAYELLKNVEDGGPVNFLVLFTVHTVGADTSQGRSIVERLQGFKTLFALGSFHFVDLSSELNCFNSHAVAKYAQECRKRMKK